MRPLSILFLCIGNSCRSPMAEAIARGLGGDRVTALSAGLAPTGRVAEGSLGALRALGYSTDTLRSKGLDEVPLTSLDVVVSLVGAPGLAAVPGGGGLRRREAWSIPDPYGADEARYRAVARDIEARVRGLLSEILGAEPPAR
jgi:arsenate reductase